MIPFAWEDLGRDRALALTSKYLNGRPIKQHTNGHFALRIWFQGSGIDTCEYCAEAHISRFGPINEELLRVGIIPDHGSLRTIFVCSDEEAD